METIAGMARSYSVYSPSETRPPLARLGPENVHQNAHLSLLAVHYNARIEVYGPSTLSPITVRDMAPPITRFTEDSDPRAGGPMGSRWRIPSPLKPQPPTAFTPHAPA
jgi:hypothetical protein